LKPIRAELGDIDSWLEIAHAVEPLFGAMPRFDATLKNAIARGAAICVRDDGRKVVGGVLLGGTAPDNWIRWLAVRAGVRGQGIGAALIAEVLHLCPAPCTISLATFGADSVPGRAARRLYARFGFEACEMLPRGPEGGTRQRFTLIRA
jgi:GNAT superfamily N-acetyltransferase